MTDLKEARRTGLEFATGNNPGVGTLILDMVAENVRLRKALARAADDLDHTAKWLGGNGHAHYADMVRADCEEARAALSATSDKRTGGNT